MAKVNDISCEVLRRRWNWLGHILRRESGERVRTTASQHWDGNRRSKSEREAKDNLKKDGG